MKDTLLDLETHTKDPEKTAPKKRTGTNVNSYLILEKDNQILLQLRKNTGYCDGMWSFVAGHVEDGESASSAMIREAREEIGLDLLPSQIEVVHIMHRKTNRLNMDVFFHCASWQGTICNLEPEKCERLEFFSFHSLPANMVEYNKTALERAAKKSLYSELGWD